jgi:two-component system NtrC family sensor kinase
MDQAWRTLFEASSTLQLFALGTQVALAWIFALVLLAFLRVTQGPSYFRVWTWSWFARAIGLSAILVRFNVHLEMVPAPESVNLNSLSSVCFIIYQSGKLLAIWWLLEGVLRFVERPPSARLTRWVPVLLVGVAILAILLSKNVEDLLLYQAPLMVTASVVAALHLVRLAPVQRSAGTRLATLALCVQALLWTAYFAIYVRPTHGFWLLNPSLEAKFAAHNSYFDLVVDVMMASSLVVLLLQDVHRRQLAAEAERARLRIELDRSERLRSLGTLVSGVAHELNNPLTAILGFAETLHGQVESQQARAVDIIKEQALRCRRIVRGLSTFSGARSPVLEPVAVRRLLERVVRGFEFELAHHAVKPVIQAPEGLIVSGDVYALEQMVANLLSNATQASPAGGGVSLIARPIEGGVEFAIEDEGPGIPDELRERVFDPFFTTRPTGRGMGLGLSVVHGIVQAHGGSVRAENRTPRGARMVITLPNQGALRTSDEQLEQREIPRPNSAMKSDSATLELLVIDDEPLLCELLREHGRRRGWHVTICTTGLEGLAELERTPTPDVVLCDLRMAPPTGLEIHDRLLVTRPELLERFLFMTGDLGSEEASRFAQRCSRPILQKPFRFDELTARVEEIARATLA